MTPYSTDSCTITRAWLFQLSHAGFMLLVARSPLSFPLLSLFSGSVALVWGGALTWRSPLSDTSSAAVYAHCAVGALALLMNVGVELTGTLLIVPNYEVCDFPFLHSFTSSPLSLSASFPLLSSTLRQSFGLLFCFEISRAWPLLRRIPSARSISASPCPSSLSTWQPLCSSRWSHGTVASRSAGRHGQNGIHRVPGAKKRGTGGGIGTCARLIMCFWHCAAHWARRFSCSRSGCCACSCSALPRPTSVPARTPSRRACRSPPRVVPSSRSYGLFWMALRCASRVQAAVVWAGIAGVAFPGSWVALVAGLVPAAAFGAAAVSLWLYALRPPVVCVCSFARGGAATGLCYFTCPPIPAVARSAPAAAANRSSAPRGTGDEACTAVRTTPASACFGPARPVSRREHAVPAHCIPLAGREAASPSASLRPPEMMMAQHSNEWRHSNTLHSDRKGRAWLTLVGRVTHIHLEEMRTNRHWL